jgi:hypothetical protein
MPDAATEADWKYPFGHCDLVIEHDGHNCLVMFADVNVSSASACRPTGQLPLIRPRHLGVKSALVPTFQDDQNLRNSVLKFNLQVSNSQ